MTHEETQYSREEERDMGAEWYLRIGCFIFTIIGLSFCSLLLWGMFKLIDKI